MAQHPLVESCAVVVRENSFVGKYLVAYVVPRCGCQLDTEQLREFLVQKLPAYMIPLHLVALAALPLTANGKIDRNALATADTPAEPFKLHSAEPKTETEFIIA